MPLRIVTFVTIFFCLLLLGLASVISHLSGIKSYSVMGAKIKKKIRFSVYSQCVWLGEIKVQHVLPNKFAHAIGLLLSWGKGIHRFTRWYMRKDQL